jgi:hypothetical protein
LKSSDSSFGTLMFQTMLTTPPVATSPADVSTASESMEFTIPAEWVGELLQFGFYNDVTTSAGQSSWTSSALYDNVVLESVAVVEPPPVGPGVPGEFVGIPIPQWALLLMAGLLGWLGAKKLRARKES